MHRLSFHIAAKYHTQHVIAAEQFFPVGITTLAYSNLSHIPSSLQMVGRLFPKNLLWYAADKAQEEAPEASTMMEVKHNKNIKYITPTFDMAWMHIVSNESPGNQLHLSHLHCGRVCFRSHIMDFISNNWHRGNTFTAKGSLIYAHSANRNNFYYHWNGNNFK